MSNLPFEVWSLITGMIVDDLEEKRGFDGLGDMACVSREFRNIVNKKRSMSATSTHASLVFPDEHLKVSLDDNGLFVEETTATKKKWGHLGVFSRRVTSIGVIRVSHWPDSTGFHPQDHCGLDVLVLNAPWLKAVVLISIRKLKRVLADMQRRRDFSKITFNFLADHHVVMDALRSEEPLVACKLIDMYTYPWAHSIIQTNVLWWKGQQMYQYSLRRSDAYRPVGIRDPERTWNFKSDANLEGLEVMGFAHVSSERGLFSVSIGWQIIGNADHDVYDNDEDEEPAYRARFLTYGYWNMKDGHSDSSSFPIEKVGVGPAHLMPYMRLWWPNYLGNVPEWRKKWSNPKFAHVIVVAQTPDGKPEQHLLMGCSRFERPRLLTGKIAQNVVTGLENLCENSHVTLRYPFRWDLRNELCTPRGNIIFS